MYCSIHKKSHFLEICIIDTRIGRSWNNVEKTCIDHCCLSGQDGSEETTSVGRYCEENDNDKGIFVEKVQAIIV